MTEAPGNEWPATLRIRDTKIHDDLGGSGRRIYTTAGNGYERMEYTRSDIANARIAELEQVLATIRDHRKKCHEYDDDVGHPRREFDVEDMLLMETIARAALKDTPNA